MDVEFFEKGNEEGLLAAWQSADNVPRVGDHVRFPVDERTGPPYSHAKYRVLEVSWQSRMVVHILCEDLVKKAETAERLKRRLSAGGGPQS